MKAALQVPEVAGPSFDAVPPAAYTDPDYAAVAEAVAGAGGAAAATVTGPAWLDEVAAHCSRESARAMLTALAVEPMRVGGRGRLGLRQRACWPGCRRWPRCAGSPRSRASCSG